MIEQQDKITETRRSLQMKPCFKEKVCRIFCPCFSFSECEDRNTTDYFASDLGNNSERSKNIKEFEMPHKNAFNFSPYDMKSSFFQGENENSEGVTPFNMDDQESEDIKRYKSNSFKNNSVIMREKPTFFKEINNMKHSQKKDWLSFPIYGYSEGQLNLIGKKCRGLLAEISTVHLEPSPTAIQKQFQSKPSQQKQNCKIIDDFWDVRYFYFEKFDEGIQIDQDSLQYLTPEIVSDYIAGKCSECKVALDAFSGIGHNATKLGTFCEKVICVEDQVKKYNYLINNAKCYEVYNIELFLKPFLDIELRNKVDLVLLHPFSSDQLSYMKQSNSFCELQSFKPNLKTVIQKSLIIGNNTVMLLPPNINVKDICHEIASAAHEQEKVYCTCSIKIEKIFFRNTLMYVAVFFGANVQTQIKINAQLNFIYKMLKPSPNQKHFQNKKLIKCLREKYGMIKLLSFVQESISLYKMEGRPHHQLRSESNASKCSNAQSEPHSHSYSNKTTKEEDNQNQINHLENFIQYVRNNKLILEHKLHKILNEEEKRSFSNSSLSGKGGSIKKPTSEHDSSFSSSNIPDYETMENNHVDFDRFVSYTIQENNVEEEDSEMQQNGLDYSEYKQRQGHAEENSSQRTQSYISNVSGFSGFKKRRPTIASSARKTIYKDSNSDERASNNSSICIKKIEFEDNNSINSEEKERRQIEKESMSPATTINKVSLPFAGNRGSLHVQKISNDLSNYSERSKLRKGLLEGSKDMKDRYEV